jgi:hypothetical protein
MFADLARAMLPSSSEECAAYFRLGLEQLDAIGSGDYSFTNELLLFAAEAKGEELDEADFHVLSNICELNMPYEEEKFPWGAFGRGLARVSGLRTLARLGRWDDREKVSIDFTLLPYLAALIEQNKIDASVALALLRLTNPAEVWGCGTAELAAISEEDRRGEGTSSRFFVTRTPPGSVGVTPRERGTKKRLRVNSPSPTTSSMVQRRGSMFSMSPLRKHRPEASRGSGVTRS